MFGVRRLSSLAACVTATLTLTGVSAFGQDVISARSGLVHYVEGDVSIDGTPVADRNGTFSEVKKDGQLATTLGRAEILLTPGVFLRVGENSSIRMRQTALDDTKVEFVSGKTMLESDTPMKDNRVTILYKEYAVTPVDHGLYEFSSEPAALSVYAGEADVTAGGQTVRVKTGRRLIFSAALAQEHFNDKDGDSLYRWSKLRSEYVSVANVSAARQAQGYGNSYDALGTGGSWFFNPFYNMYTFLPNSGMAFSPFGFGFYSPYAFGQYYGYNPYGYNTGYYPGGGSSSGTSTKTGTGTGNGNGGWQRSLNHPVRPVSSGIVATSHSSSGAPGFSGRSSGGSTVTWGNAIPAAGYGSGVSNGSNAVGSMGHMGGGAPSGGGGSAHGK